MLILTIRTDKPEAELGLYNDTDQAAYITWQAHRQLSETIHLQLKDLLANQQHQLVDLQGIVVFQGPGSFTGLRIGISLANALANALKVPIVGKTGNTWQSDGIETLMSGDTDSVVLPEYGAPVHITAQRK